MEERLPPPGEAHRAPRRRTLSPAIQYVLLYSGGILLAGKFAPSTPILLWSSVVLAGLGLGLWQARRYAVLSFTVLAWGILSVAVLHTRLALHPAPKDVYHAAKSERVLVEGEVCRYPEVRGNRTDLIVEVSRVGAQGRWLPVQGKALVRVSGFEPAASYGDLIRVDGRLRRPRPSRNPGEFDYRRYLLAEGISATVSVYRSDRLEVLRSGGGWWSLREIVYPLKRWITRTIEAHAGAAEAALICGLITGERGGIPEDLVQGFARSGVIHVLAVSGLHVGLVILITLALFTLFRLPRPLRTPLMLGVLLFYVYLTNQRPSVVRASIMGGAVLLAYDLQRRTSVLNTLAVAALVILVLNPLALFQVSFQLSFAAVLGIVLLYPRLDLLVARRRLRAVKRTTAGRYLLGLFLVSIAAQLGTLPLTAVYFGRVSLIAGLINLLVIPLVFLTVGFAATALVLTPVWGFLANLYWEAAVFCAAAMIAAVQTGSGFSLAAVDYPQPDLIHLGLFAAALVLLLGWERRRARFVAIVIVLVTGNLLVWRPALREPRLEAVFFDVGQGDSALVVTPTGKTLLIDAGGRWAGSDAGSQIIRPYLRGRGIERLDAVVFTHAHEDHYGGLVQLLRTMKIGVIYGPGQRSEAESFREMMGLADSLHVPVRALGRGEQIEGFEPVRLFVLHPSSEFVFAGDADGGDELNDGSVVIKLQYGRETILFTGDTEAKAEAQYLRYGKFLQSSVLKVAHHGSNTSTGPRLVDRVMPRYAVVSVGEINSYGLPDEEPLERLRKSGAAVFRTDQVGAVVFRSDGNETRRVRWSSE